MRPQIRKLLGNLRLHEYEVKSTNIKRLGFPGGSVVKNLPANAEDMGQSLGQEDPQEKEMATHPSILAWKSPWTKEPGGLQSMGSEETETT